MSELQSRNCLSLNNGRTLMARKNTGITSKAWVALQKIRTANACGRIERCVLTKKIFICHFMRWIFSDNLSNTRERSPALRTEQRQADATKWRHDRKEITQARRRRWWQHDLNAVAHATATVLIYSMANNAIYSLISSVHKKSLVVLFEEIKSLSLTTNKWSKTKKKKIE